jgi:hypothetical protein
MTLPELLAELDSRQALIVHCSRPGRGGEISQTPPPIYPDDLRATITDLAKGAREISCSVVWPEHQRTFGTVGIVVRPHSTEAILRVGTSDAGNIDGLGGAASPFSSQAVAETFDSPSDYNEWVVLSGTVLGIFVNLSGQLEVARLIAPPIDEIDEGRRWLAPTSSVEPVGISLSEIQADFPDLPIYTFVRGCLVTIAVDAHPYV